ncbi:Asparagine--tRNA ligase, cytoplasmic [Arachis hypogaea]|uniref:Asparagine--tRNA ligase, cytoplasmic n=2 Tax=Arachis hypogaea TaxID=3818 RepID=A0A6B9V7L0_ARAHY|nr:Asparagine--tRNA ligase, cytoplasmic [Arachis hypogaea]
MRIRNTLSFATHSFFNGQGFLDVQIPIITTTDYEEFGKLFQVAGLEQKPDKHKLSTIHETDGVSLDIVKAAAKEKSNIVETLKRTEGNREALAAAVQDLRKTNELVSQLEAIEKKNLKSLSSKDEVVDASRDLFLTVSGRLHLESYACALGNVYLFGPRFQADKTYSAKYALEMWMVEVEMAFSQLRDAMNCASDYFNHLIMYVLETCHEDMKFIAKRIETPASLVFSRLRQVKDKKFETNFKSGVALTAKHLRTLEDSDPLHWKD